MTTIDQFSEIIYKDYHTQLFLPELATLIGLEESIVLHKIHYWLQKCGKLIDNNLWIYNNLREWCEQFPFLTPSKIKRVIYSLEDQNIIFSNKVNKSKGDHTKWYSLNYEKLVNLLSLIQPKLKKTPVAKRNNRLSQNCPTINSKQNTNYSKKYMSNDIKEDIQTNVIEIDQEVCNTMIKTWNEIFINSNSKIILTKNRNQKLQLLWNLVFNHNLNEWRNYCLSVNSSKFLMGEKKKDFKAHFDWLIKQEIVERVLSGEFDIGDRVADITKEEQKINILETKQNLNLKLSTLRAQKDREEALRATERLAEKLSIKELIKLEEGWNDQEKAKVKSAFEDYMEQDLDDDFITEYKPLFKNRWATIGAELAYEQFKIRFYLKKSFNDFINEAKAFIDRNGFNSSVTV